MTGGVTGGGRVRPVMISVLLGLVLVATSLASSARAAEDDFETPDFRTACPEMTDSVYRLYVAYFNRIPDQVGWQYWLDTYASPGAGLVVMSQAFADSQEFVETYGALDNAQFVELVYWNVLGRSPDPAGFEHWVTSLDNGYPRGLLMIAFSESQEFVNRTRTAAPLAGWLSWYDEKVQFICGQGDVAFNPAELPDTAYADIIVTNWSETQTSTMRLGVDVSEGAQSVVPPQELPPFTYGIYWNLDMSFFDATGVWLDVDENPDLWWTIVIYDEPHSNRRSPYTDAFDAATAAARSASSTTAAFPVEGFERGVFAID